MSRPNVLLSGRINFEPALDERRNDPNIFKAVFLAGAPGSGKDFILSKLLTGYGLVELNSDKAFEFLMKKNNLDFLMPDNQADQRAPLRDKAKSMTSTKTELTFAGRLGVVINGTGANAPEILDVKSRLEKLGYDCAMVYVSVSNEISKSRNISRGQHGGRSVPEVIRYSKWLEVQNSTNKLKEFFKEKFFVVDNSRDYKEVEAQMMGFYKQLRRFVSAPVTHPAAHAWLKAEHEKARR